MIVICLAFILVLFLAKPLKNFFRLAVRGLVGIVGFMIVNAVLGSFDIYVGVNLYTVLFVAFLGFPGFVGLYLLSFFMN